MMLQGSTKFLQQLIKANKAEVLSIKIKGENLTLCFATLQTATVCK
jgi:hypothetical protein